MVFYQEAGAQRAVRARMDVALVNPVSARRRPVDLELRLTELTSFFSFFSFHTPLATLERAASVDAALANGSKDFCLMQTPGHLFYGYDSLSFAMTAAMDNCRLVTGRVDEDGRLDPACLLINRRAWEQLGRPSFGVPGDYRLPEAARAAGLAPQPWDAAVARTMWACNTGEGDIYGWLAALDDVTAAGPQEPAIEASLAFLRNVPDRMDAPKKIFVFNSENDADFPQLRYRPGLDTAFVLASGFKANRILETLGFHDGTRVVTYDYSAPALMLRRLMIEEWDGRDFAGFFASARTRIDAAFPAGVGYLPGGALVKDPAAVAGEFKREMAGVFESEAQWLAHWQRFRALAHVYVEADVIGDCASARAMIAAHARGHTVLWMSDMFNSPNAVGKFSWNRRRAAYDVIAASLRDHAASDLILGAPPALWVRP